MLGEMLHNSGDNYWQSYDKFCDNKQQVLIAYRGMDEESLCLLEWRYVVVVLVDDAILNLWGCVNSKIIRSSNILAKQF